MRISPGRSQRAAIHSSPRSRSPERFFQNPAGRQNVHAQMRLVRRRGGFRPGSPTPSSGARRTFLRGSHGRTSAGNEVVRPLHRRSSSGGEQLGPLVRHRHPVPGTRDPRRGFRHAKSPAAAKELLNRYNETGYGGPAPPEGRATPVYRDPVRARRAVAPPPERHAPLEVPESGRREEHCGGDDRPMYERKRTLAALPVSV